MMQKLIMLSPVLLLLMSCSAGPQAPDTVYYLLDAEPAAHTSKNSEASIRLEKVNLPNYLNTNQLVMRDSGHILLKANYHSWADSLDESIQRALLGDLNAMNAKNEFVVWCNDCIGIRVFIEHFYPSSEGKLLLSGHFEISGLDNKKRLTRFQFNNDLQEAGYANAVKQMRDQVNALAEHINQQLLENYAL